MRILKFVPSPELPPSLSFSLSIYLFPLSFRLLRGENNTAASDAYAFGIILYEVYSRKDPYEGEQMNKVLKQVADPAINKRPPVPSGCPAKISTLMAECLDADPAKRPTFEELDLQLKRLDVSNVEPASFIKSNTDRSKDLLYEVFPPHVAEALRHGRQVEPESRDIVTIFFSDIVGFTHLSSTLSPMKVSDMLGRLYSELDRLSDEHDVFKVESKSSPLVFTFVAVFLPWGIRFSRGFFFVIQQQSVMRTWQSRTS